MHRPMMREPRRCAGRHIALSTEQGAPPPNRRNAGRNFATGRRTAHPQPTHVRTRHNARAWSRTDRDLADASRILNARGITMTAQLQALTHGTSGLVIAYLLVLLPMVGGLARARAAAHKYLFAPLLAAPLLLLAVLCTALLDAVLHAVGLSGRWTHFPIGLLVFVYIGFAGGRGLALRPAAREPEHRRGAFVSKVPVKEIREAHSAVPVTLAGVSIPLVDETKHFKIIGTTGTGKSTAIREILSAALLRGDRVVIADPDGGYLSRHYDPNRGDVILNPFDPHACKWDLFGEITEEYDIDTLARALIPDSGDEDRVWSEDARTLFTEVIRQMRRSDTCDDREL